MEHEDIESLQKYFRGSSCSMWPGRRMWRQAAEGTRRFGLHQGKTFVFLRAFVVKLLIRNLHLVDENTISRCCAVAIELHGIRELIIHRSGEKRIVRNVHRHPHAVNRQRVMQHGVSNGVIVVFGNNVVPGSRSEARKSNAGRVPAF